MNKLNPCYHLKELFAKVKGNRYDFSDLYSGEPEKLVAFKEKFDQHFAVFEQYKQSVIALLKEWCGFNEFIDNVSFLLDGRVVVEGDMDLRTRLIHPPEYFPSVIAKIEGDLQLDHTRIEHADFLEEVNSIYCIEECSLKSLNNLRKVNKTLYIEGSEIETLPELIEVGSIYAEKLATLRSMPKLEKATRINASKSGLKELPVLEEVEVNLDISQTRVVGLPSLKRTGDINVAKNPQFKHLPNLEFVNGGIFLGKTSVEEIPRLERVVSSFSATDAKKLRKVPLLKEVGEAVDISGTQIKGLANLVHAGSFHAANLATLASLEKLVTVKRNMVVSGTSLKAIPKLETVGESLVLGSLGESGFRTLMPKLRKVGDVYSSLFILTADLKKELSKNTIEVVGEIKLT
jgi:hypothetical protein